MEIKVEITHRSGSLKKHRMAAGLSQSQLANTTGLNVRTLQHYEQGTKDINAAKLSTILKLCNALNCSLRELLSDPETLDLLDEYEARNI